MTTLRVLNCPGTEHRTSYSSCGNLRTISNCWDSNSFIPSARVAIGHLLFQRFPRTCDKIRDLILQRLSAKAIQKIRKFQNNSSTLTLCVTHTFEQNWTHIVKSKNLTTTCVVDWGRDTYQGFGNAAKCLARLSYFSQFTSHCNINSILGVPFGVLQMRQSWCRQWIVQASRGVPTCIGAMRPQRCPSESTTDLSVFLFHTKV